jgi:hypothetical protein
MQISRMVITFPSLSFSRYHTSIKMSNKEKGGWTTVRKHTLASSLTYVQNQKLKQKLCTHPTFDALRQIFRYIFRIVLINLCDIN